MAIYGGGWCYKRKGYTRDEIYNELMTKGIFFTDYTDDYTTKNAQNVLNLLEQAKANDIIYLKSYPISKEKNLKIEAIGYFLDDVIIEETIAGQKGNARKVKWVKELWSKPIPFNIPSGNIYNTTLYEENNDKIISIIMNCLDEK